MAHIICCNNLTDALSALTGAVSKRAGKTVVFCEDRLTLLAERAVVGKTGGTFLTEVFEEEDAGYKTYTNDDVKFTLEYPAGYDIDEPYDNLVLISSGDNFRVVAEYAYTTADGNRFIYSAAD